MALFNNTSFKLLEQGLDATWYKQKVINQNIASADTPDYKCKNVEFRAVLKEKCKYQQYHKEEQNEEVKLEVVTTTNNGTNHLFDGNNVNIDTEMMKLADTQIQYDTLAGKISNEFAMLRTAIRR